MKKVPNYINWGSEKTQLEKVQLIGKLLQINGLYIHIGVYCLLLIINTMLIFELGTAI